MSSILNALRKVESESLQADKAQPVLQKKIDAKSVIRSRHREYRLPGKILLLVVPALTLAVASWVAIQYGPLAVSKISSAPAKVSELEKKEAGQKEEFREDLERRKQSEPSQPNPARERISASKAAPEKESPSALPAKRPLSRGEDPPIEDPELKLQAIVWSESPENCFAVINGIIVRVGGSVEGVSVLEIGTDYVSIKSGQRTWKIRMMAQ